VFLDEIGEIDEALQVKLLRVLQTRSFQRIGETTERRFLGKLITATNRDLGAAMEAGRFREDLYYRLCSDIVLTPSLFEQLQGAPDDLGEMVRFIAGRISGAAGDAVAREVEAFIHDELGPAYPWPGNFRELEQCVRNVMVRGEYRPRRGQPRDPERALIDALRGTALTADDVLRICCSIVYAETDNYVRTAERLGLDRRTVKNRVDPSVVAKVRSLHGS
jgi:transcriptional regulator with PAS, ATPase and Fis domain